MAHLPSPPPSTLMGVGECVCGIFHPRFQLFKDSSFTLLEREKREWWALGGRSRRRSFSHSDMLRTLMTCWTSRVCSTQIPRAGYIEIVFSSPLARRDPSPPSLMVSPRSAPTFYFYFSKNCCFFYYFRLFFSKISAPYSSRRFRSSRSSIFFDRVSSAHLIDVFSGEV